MFGSTATIDTTGEILARSAGDASAPNEVLVKVTAGTLLVGGLTGDAVVPITASDGFVPFNILSGEQLYGKTSSSTATVFVIQSQPKVT